MLIVHNIINWTVQNFAAFIYSSIEVVVECVGKNIALNLISYLVLKFELLQF